MSSIPHASCVYQPGILNPGLPPSGAYEFSLAGIVLAMSRMSTYLTIVSTSSFSVGLATLLVLE